MSFSEEPPLTRRAARDAARATAEQPTLTTSGQIPTFTSTIVLGEDGQPLTRRRLRELRQQETGWAPPSEAGAQPAAPPSATGWDEPLERTVTAERTVTVEASATIERPAPSTSTASAFVLPTSGPVPAFAPQTQAPVPERIAEPEAQQAVAPPAVAETRQEWSAPDGHWTRQLEAVEDEDDALETTFSREVGSASPTTSALIIQEAPVAMDLGGPLDSTGEILLTGSIPLSPTLSTTGSADRLADAADRSDRFDDRRLHDATTQDAQPVRASAIASQHALGTPIVSDRKPRGGGRGLTVLLVTASALAVIVTGLVIAAVALKWI